MAKGTVGVETAADCCTWCLGSGTRTGKISSVCSLLVFGSHTSLCCRSQACSCENRGVRVGAGSEHCQRGSGTSQRGTWSRQFTKRKSRVVHMLLIAMVASLRLVSIRAFVSVLEWCKAASSFLTRQSLSSISFCKIKQSRALSLVLRNSMGLSGKPNRH